jgi:diguanylate cyclase (GGDEF)-like protein
MTPMFGAPPHGQHMTDPQTGLELGATWDRWLVEEDARTKRYRRPATVVLVELDGLDRLVERLGPAAADRLIPPVAATLRRHARAADRVARLAKGRFGVILVETDEVQAINYVERVRAAADQWLEAGAIATRLSIGWAEANGSRGLEDAAAAAEERLNGERRRHAAADEAAGSAMGDGPLAEPALG